MGNLFAKKPKREITDADRAVLNLKTQRRRIEEQRKRVEAAIERELAVARELVAAKRKERALLALKKKKLHESQLEQIDAWLLSVESMLADVETAMRQNRLFSALKSGSEALKQLQKEVSVADVEQLMQDTAEAKEYEDHLRQLLGESWTGQDEAAAEKELAALEEQFGEVERLELPQVPERVVLDEQQQQEALPTAAAQQAEQAAVAAAAEELGLPDVPTHTPVLQPEAAKEGEERRLEGPMLAQ